MFEQTFKNIDDILRKGAGCTSELDYTEQSSWLLFLKYLDAETELAGIIQLDDCVTNVLLLAYAKKQGLKKVQAAIRKRAELLKTDDGRERDRQWLLIYQTWSIAELKGYGQGFLAKLKSNGFEFFAMPSTEAGLIPLRQDLAQ